MQPPREWPRRRKFIVAALASSLIAFAMWAAAGPRTGLGVAVIGYVFTAWVSDDALGNCFIFAMLFLLVVTVVLMALVGSVLLNA